jgi:hypothetical protein
MELSRKRPVEALNGLLTLLSCPSRLQRWAQFMDVTLLLMHVPLFSDDPWPTILPMITDLEFPWTWIRENEVSERDLMIKPPRDESFIITPWLYPPFLSSLPFNLIHSIQSVQKWNQVTLLMKLISFLSERGKGRNFDLQRVTPFLHEIWRPLVFLGLWLKSIRHTIKGVIFGVKNPTPQESTDRKRDKETDSIFFFVSQSLQQKKSKLTKSER